MTKTEASTLKKVKVRMVGNSVGLKHGEEIEVDEATAERLFKNGHATEAKSEK